MSDAREVPPLSAAGSVMRELISRGKYKLYTTIYMFFEYWSLSDPPSSQGDVI